MAYGFVFALLLVGGAISLIENARARNGAYAVYLCFAVPVLFVFAGLRAPNVDADYGLYTDWFNSLKYGTLGDNPFLKDPSFAVLGFGLDWLGLGIATLIAIYSGACLWAQFAFARRAVALRWLPLAMFLVLSRFFIPHEMTQIRSAVAIPVMSLAILQFYSRKPWLGWVLLLAAMSFHFSAILALPICLAVLLGVKFSSRVWVVGCGVLAAIGYVAFAKVALLLAVFARTSDYVTGSYETTGISLFSLYLLSRVAVVGFATLVLWRRMTPLERLMIVCSSMGVMLEVALASNDALSIRSGELFGLFDIASALMILGYLRWRAALVYVLFLLCLGGVFFRSTTKIIQPYASRLPL